MSHRISTRTLVPYQSVLLDCLQFLAIRCVSKGDSPFKVFPRLFIGWRVPLPNRIVGSANALVILSLFSSIAAAQAPEFPSPQQEHEWLEQFEGEWITSSKTTALPDVPAMECTGTMKSRLLGGFWVLNEMKSDIGGVNFNAVQTLGYDPEKEKYVGTWVDSMTDHLWQYEGTVDESGKKLSLVAEGPDMTGTGKMTKYRDSYEFKSPDLIIATSEVMDEQGEWNTFMTGEMKRK